MIRQDSSSLLTKAKSKASIAASSTKSIADEYKSKAVDLTAPHRQLAWEKYEEHLQDIIEESIAPVLIPFYEEKVKPVIEICIAKAFDVARIIFEASETNYNNYRAVLVSKTEITSSSALIKIHEMNSKIEIHQMEFDIPSFLIEFLTYVRGDSAGFVDLFITFLFYFSIYKLRWFILRSILWFLLLPFRIMWFFSPIRIIFFRKGSKKHAKKQVPDAELSESDDDSEM